MVKKIILSLCVIIMSWQSAFAFKEDFNFIIFDLPLGWEIVDKQETEFTISDVEKTAFFNYKMIPVYNIDLKKYAEAVMRAYGGYKLIEKRKNVYSFKYFSQNMPAETTVQFCKDDYACIQSAIGESDFFKELFDSGELK